MYFIFGGRFIVSLRKALISALAAVCAVSLLVPAAFAHGCHGSSRQTQPAQCGLCTVEGCQYAGRHTHGRTTYCGFDHEDGVCDGACAPLCAVEDCELTGRHTHDGVTCCGYDHEDGFCDGACLSLCPVEGCALTGRHSHSGVTYCGTCHEEGFCDGTCPAAVVPASGRHHGRCH